MLARKDTPPTMRVTTQCCNFKARESWLEILASIRMNAKHYFAIKYLNLKWIGKSVAICEVSLYFFNKKHRRKEVRSTGCFCTLAECSRRKRRARTKGYSSNDASNHASSGTAENKRHRVHVLRGKCALAYGILIALLVQVLASFIRSRHADCYHCCYCNCSCILRLSRFLTPRNFQRELFNAEISTFLAEIRAGASSPFAKRNFRPLIRCSPRRDNRFSRITLEIPGD